MVSERLIRFIKQVEGYREVAYQCSAGVWTIGWGHTKGVRPNDTINVERADRYLREDIEVCEQAVERNVTVYITQGMYDALCSFVFNFGETKFRDSTLLQWLNQEEYLAAANEFSKWIYSRGKVERGLVKRRKAERDMFMSSTWPE